MSTRRILRPRPDICQLCDFLLPRQYNRTKKSFLPVNSRAFSTTRNSCAKNPISPFASPRGSRSLSQQATTNRPKQASKQVSQLQLEKDWTEVKSICESLLSSERAPSEEDTLKTLTRCNALAEILLHDPFIHSTFTPTSKNTDGATSGLLSLDASTQKSAVSILKLTNDLSQLAFSIVKHPAIFITPKVLDLYTIIQANLRRAHTFPEVFHMYSHKPLPQENTVPIKYSKQNPNRISNAIPSAVADRALQAAIDAKELFVALELIEYSYTTKAFNRAKFTRKLLLPTTGVVAAPVAAYVVASKLALLQTTMDSEMATNVAFAGILAYTFFTGTIGVVALTTANDQMDRVTWAPGIPLRERWMREEERAALDKVAGAWGFRETWRRGEEEGEDWDALKEWIGNKGMILDRVELMEGME
ncbi:hypothetical protein B0O99DRAFT_650244 [Bisporella sp. PMI_857]|nr:hypothetical protein B0O99DRAFT_650244 [Bisporella sp. PMI_857]